MYIFIWKDGMTRHICVRDDVLAAKKKTPKSEGNRKYVGDVAGKLFQQKTLDFF